MISVRGASYLSVYSRQSVGGETMQATPMFSGQSEKPKSVVFPRMMAGWLVGMILGGVSNPPVSSYGTTEAREVKQEIRGLQHTIYTATGALIGTLFGVAKVLESKKKDDTP